VPQSRSVRGGEKNSQTLPGFEPGCLVRLFNNDAVSAAEVIYRRMKPVFSCLKVTPEVKGPSE